MERVRNMASTGQYPQSIVIEGPQGSGKATLARLIAMSAVCLDTHNNRPCGVCDGCKKARLGGHVDIKELVGSGAARTLSVAAVRDLRAEAFIRPNEADHKVFMVMNAQSLSEQGQNALLKVMEEPPAYVLFLFTCLSRKQMLETVLSRSVIISMGSVSMAEGLPLLQQQFPDAGREQIEKAIAEAGGILGQAAQRLTGDHASSVAEEMAQAVLGSSEIPLLKICARMERDRAVQRETLDQFLLILRDANVLRAGGHASISGHTQAACMLMEKLTAEQLMTMTDHVCKMRDMLECNVNGPLLMSVLCAGLRKTAR